MVLTLILLAISYLIIVSFFITRFIYKRFKNDYLGNIFIYIIIGYLLCFSATLCLSIFTPNKDSVNFFVDDLLPSFFNAAKMMVLSFDTESIKAFIEIGKAPYILFVVLYYFAAIHGFLFLNISILFTLTQIGLVKFGNLWKNKPGNVKHFILSDHESKKIAARLGHELKSNNKNKVVFYVTRASQKTEEGTEYKEFLDGQGFDVRVENFNIGLTRLLVNGSLGKNTEIKIYVLVSDDENAVTICNYFKKAIVDNKKFIHLKNSIENNNSAANIQKVYESLGRIKIFLTYHQTDFDVNYNYSGSTLQIINTLSEYDIVSSEFIHNNPISDFIDLNQINETNNEAMNITFIGFGKINKPIFEKMTYAYQLWGDNVNKVNYHILDKNSDSLIKQYQNVYTNKNNKEIPYLYSLESGCNGDDLSAYETLYNYISNIKNSGNKNRFNKNGFEIFIISLSDTNTDVNIAENLRHILYRLFTIEELSKTKIFVRIGDSIISDNFTAAHKNEDGEIPIYVFGQNRAISHFIEDTLPKMRNFALLSEESYSSPENAKIHLLTSSKNNTNKNTSTFFNFKVKLSLYSNKNNEVDYAQLKKEIELSSAKNNISECIPEFNRIVKICELEHNRWMAFEYLNNHYLPLELNEFNLNRCIVENGDNVKLHTKFDHNTKHICMLTNEKLLTLQNELIKRNSECMKLAKKLCFLNDLNLLSIVVNNIEKEAKNVQEQNRKK